MVDNIELASERQNKLNQLDDKSQDTLLLSNKFQKESNRVKHKEMAKYYKIVAAVVGIIVLIVVIAVVAVFVPDSGDSESSS